MTKSNRIAGQQFGGGLTVDATRLEQDLVTLANRGNAPLPADVARRWMETHQVYGFIGDQLPVYDPEEPDNVTRIARLPWMGSYNSRLTANANTDPALQVTDYPNKFRFKGTTQPLINPLLSEIWFDAGRSLTDMYSWEVAYRKSSAHLLDRWTVTLAADLYYPNTFTWGAGAPTPEVEDGSVNDMVLQVIVDSALASENRTASLQPLLVRKFKANDWQIWPVTRLPDMKPPMSVATQKQTVCLMLNARLVIPENASVRLVISVPQYRRDYSVSSWTQYPWRDQVFSQHVTLLESTEAY